MNFVGLDIGGTKCAVSQFSDGKVSEVLRIPTGDFTATFEILAAGLARLLEARPAVVGISCGGPLDSDRGIIVSPPNLAKSWHGVPICQLLLERFGVQACLMNDADACALAEWKFGAGRGTKHMIFLTSGTGLGSGLILNGQLYQGANGNAGEIGHVRLGPDGPVGYGKAGSAEGFYSGGGIARLAERHLKGADWARHPWHGAAQPLTTKFIAEAALAGDPLARQIFAEAGTRLGEALAILLDLLNPERIVLGGFYPQCRPLLEPTMRVSLEREALPMSRQACEILPSELGETIGSQGAIAAALHVFGGRP